MYNSYFYQDPVSVDDPFNPSLDLEPETSSVFKKEDSWKIAKVPSIIQRINLEAEIL